MPLTRRELIRLGSAAGAWIAAGAPALGDSGRAAFRARVLGIAQDGGLPHLGCSRSCCVLARQDPSRSRRVACLGLSVAPSGPLFMVDATPDFPWQAHDLRRASGVPTPPGRPVDGILLTHAHVGHYAGLIHLGREAMAAKGVLLLGTRRMLSFLESNRPWSLLMDGGHVLPEVLEPGSRRSLAPGLEAEAIPAPHRDEISDTMGFLFRGPERSLLYVPDTDGWDRWSPPVEERLKVAEIALLDGTFFDTGEVPGRDPEEIPHPTIRRSMDRLGPLAGQAGRRILFTHLNHSNPAILEGSPEHAEVLSRGFAVATEGEEFLL